MACSEPGDALEAPLSHRSKGGACWRVSDRGDGKLSSHLLEEPILAKARLRVFAVGAVVSVAWVGGGLLSLYWVVGSASISELITTSVTTSRVGRCILGNYWSTRGAVRP